MPNYVQKTCKNCAKEYQTLYKYRNKSKFCSQNCSKTFQVGKNSPSYGRTGRLSKDTYPEWAKKISSTLKLRQVNVGEKNGMKKYEARQKVSKSRKKMILL